MPAPDAAAIESHAANAFASAELAEDAILKLIAVLSKLGVYALGVFFDQATVQKGILASVDPTTGTGTTTGPGKLAPLAAASVAGDLIEKASDELVAEEINGEARPDFAKALARVFAEGIEQFTGRAEVLAGIPIAANKTSMPGMLSLPSHAIATDAETILRECGMNGEGIARLAPALDAMVAGALSEFAATVVVAPGIDAMTPATTSTGSLE